MNKKYLVVPGVVISESDHKSHDISAYELIRLYGVDPKDCHIFPDNGVSHTGYILQADQIILEPDPTGKYEIPKEPWQIGQN